MSTAMLKRSMGKVDLGHEPTATLPDGTVLEHGTIVKISGALGDFRFRWASKNGAEITVYDAGRSKIRTFRADRVTSIRKNKRLAAVKAEHDARYDGLTAGQKAALTKKLRKEA